MPTKIEFSEIRRKQPASTNAIILEIKATGDKNAAIAKVTATYSYPNTKVASRVIQLSWAIKTVPSSKYLTIPIAGTSTIKVALSAAVNCALPVKRELLIDVASVSSQTPSPSPTPTPSTTPAPTPTPAGNLVVSSAPVVRSSYQVGETIQASVTYKNSTSANIIAKQIVLAMRRQGQPNSGAQYYDDFPDMLTNKTVAPGQSITLTSTKVLTAELVGNCRIYPTYQDSQGLWRDGAAKTFVVLNSTASPSPSPTPSQTPAPTPIPVTVKINSGSGAVSDFTADTSNAGFTSMVSDTIDVSGVSNPAPMQIYQTDRIGDELLYTISNIQTGTKASIRLHFAETWHNQPGQRKFNILINGTQAIAEFDIFAAAGGKNKAIIKDFVAIAANNQIVVQLTKGSVDSPKLCGLEVMWNAGTTTSPTPTPTPAPTSTPSPSPTNTPVPSTTVGVPTQAELNTNLNGIADYSSEDPFLDKAKSARSWWWRDEAPKGSFPTDENGYPLSIPSNRSFLDTVIFADNPTVSAGRYVVMWDGVGTISWQGGTVVSQSSNQQVVDFGTGNIVLTLNKTGSTPGASDYFKNLRIVRQDQLSLYQSGEIFNPAFLAKLKGFRRLRFMDWMGTNFSQQKDWANRPKPSDYTYADKGCPIEVMVALCNKLQVHPWFCMPHLATDNYVEKFATLVRDTLQSSLQIFLEFSNETWNWQFTQATWCLNAGKALWGSDVGDAHVQYTGMRACQNTQTWKRVFGSAASRVFGVLATQTAWKGLEESLLNAPKFIASGGTRPADVCKLYAITFYFSGNLIHPDYLNQVLTWRSDSDKGIAKAAEQIRSGTLIPKSNDFLTDVKSYLTYHAQVAARNGMALVGYEGNPHVLAFASAGDNAEAVSFATEIHRSPAMQQLIEENLANWKQAGGTCAFQFTDIGPYTKWGCWGALESVYQNTSPKWQALQNTMKLWGQI